MYLSLNSDLALMVFPPSLPSSPSFQSACCHKRSFGSRLKQTTRVRGRVDFSSPTASGDFVYVLLPQHNRNTWQLPKPRTLEDLIKPGSSSKTQKTNFTSEVFQWPSDLHVSVHSIFSRSAETDQTFLERESSIFNPQFKPSVYHLLFMEKVWAE